MNLKKSFSKYTYIAIIFSFLLFIACTSYLVVMNTSEDFSTNIFKTYTTTKVIPTTSPITESLIYRTMTNKLFPTLIVTVTGTPIATPTVTPTVIPMVILIATKTPTSKPTQQPTIKPTVKTTPRPTIRYIKKVTPKPTRVKTSRATITKSYSKQYGTMSSNVFNILKKYGNKHHLPVYVWYPIVMTESKGIPNTSHRTSKEYSVGCFQVNTYAHKDCSPSRLKNPAYNANYQMPKLYSVYITGKKRGLTGINLVCYVAKYGQRPAWTSKYRQSLYSYYKRILN